MTKHFQAVYLTAKEAAFDKEINDTFELNVRTDIW
jgi:hypothetical protein